MKSEQAPIAFVINSDKVFGTHSQNVVTADLVVQRVEAIAGFCLRFRVQRLLQFLNSFRS